MASIVVVIIKVIIVVVRSYVENVEFKCRESIGLRSECRVQRLDV